MGLMRYGRMDGSNGISALELCGRMYKILVVGNEG